MVRLSASTIPSASASEVCGTDHHLADRPPLGKVVVESIDLLRRCPVAAPDGERRPTTVEASGTGGNANESATPSRS
jgi:hypothetical protein